MVGVAANPQLGMAFLFLLLSFIAAIVSDRLRVGYATVLLAIGFALSFLRASGELSSVPLDNAIILGLVVRP